MKKILLLTLFITSICFSQTKIKKEYLNEDRESLKAICKIDHRCTLKHKYDSFEDTHVYDIGMYNSMSLSKSGTAMFSLYRYSRKGLDSYILMMSINKKECVTEDSYVNFIFEDGTKIKIYSNSKTIRCGTGIVSVDITEHINVLSSKKISKFRVSLELNHDYKAGKKRVLKFMDRIKCISEIELPTE